jgi:ribosomal protein S18 acetylase RimI-like enzyme
MENKIREIIPIFSRSFFDDPFYRTVFPQRREQKLIHCFRSFLQFARRYGKIRPFYHKKRLIGASVWLSSSYAHFPLVPYLCSGALFAMLKTGPSCTIKLNRIASEVRKHYKNFKIPEEYLYLFLAGIHPDYQNRGLGKQMLAPMLLELDKKRLPCILETTTPENIRFYRSLGFKIVHQSLIPSINIDFFYMLREPTS